MIVSQIFNYNFLLLFVPLFSKLGVRLSSKLFSSTANSSYHKVLGNTKRGKSNATKKTENYA
ncbi:hypothetical protein D5R40_07350 [Okeania hirsuta]|uniref:Uncharacterized protein n=1 Tax=Okeania hirsuta TaxID=1458930 RepID=A0A3N6PH85_9CYAN|nr:hypothetical protein D5R40_07350 [Okeania hirsuta]